MDQPVSALSAPILSLPNLQSGQMAVIEAIEGAPDVCQCLSVLGLTSGTCIRVLMGGAPCAVEVGASRLVLRGEHARAVRVTPLD